METQTNGIMKTLKENSTHIARLENNQINIYSKGMVFDTFEIKEELLWTIPVDEEDDLFAIFERLDEDNRCNIAEFENAMS